MNSYLKIAIVVIAFVVGFFLGRKTIDVEEKIEYVKGETIRDTIVINEPTFVEIQPHTSLENWKPNELPALYKKVMPKQVIPNWVKPTGAHDAYKIGDKVIFESHVWVSKIDNNTWSPTAYPAGWQKQ